MYVSIHAPARGATPNLGRIFERKMFQFTPLREGRRKEDCDWKLNLGFQFTPLREGRRNDVNNFFGGSSVSIHAPARGATDRHRG